MERLQFQRSAGGIIVNLEAWFGVVVNFLNVNRTNTNYGWVVHEDWRRCHSMLNVEIPLLLSHFLIGSAPKCTLAHWLQSLSLLRHYLLPLTFVWWLKGEGRFKLLILEEGKGWEKPLWSVWVGISLRHCKDFQCIDRGLWRCLNTFCRWVVIWSREVKG